jgi:peptidylprolyl isomerase
MTILGLIPSGKTASRRGATWGRAVGWGAALGCVAIVAATAQTAPPLRVEPMSPAQAKAAAKAPAKTTAKAPAKAAPKSVAKKAAAPAAPATRPAAAPAVTKATFAPAPAGATTPARGPQMSDPAPTPSSEDWRPLDPETAILFETTKGRVIVELAPELAPGHVARVKELAREGFYDGLTFHRVIDGFMAQGGDPKGDGSGNSTKPDLRAEFSFRRGADTPFVRAVERGGASLGWVRTVPIMSQPDVLMQRTADRRVSAWGLHCPGVASMARAEDENSANSQFFLIRSAYPSLDRRYTIWGRAIVGLDVIRALKTGEPVVDPDRMTRVRVLADVPASERPVIHLQRTEGPAFRARLAQVMEARGAAFSNCDISPEVRIAQ